MGGVDTTSKRVLALAQQSRVRDRKHRNYQHTHLPCLFVIRAQGWKGKGGEEPAHTACMKIHKGRQRACLTFTCVCTLLFKRSAIQRVALREYLHSNSLECPHPGARGR